MTCTFEEYREAAMSDIKSRVSRRTFTQIGVSAVAGLGISRSVAAQTSGAEEMLKSEFLMLLRFEYPDRIPGSPKSAGLPGMRRGIVPISRGTFEGPRLKGTVIPPSGEWAY